jgi:VanZ family protein
METPRWEPSWIDVAFAAFAIGALALTVWYSLGPAPPGHGSDKQLHAVAYFVDTLAVLLAVVWRPGRRRGLLNVRALPVAAGMLILGGLVELAQWGLVDRDAQFTDWMADALGIGIALAVFVGLRRAGARAGNRPSRVS